MKLVTYVDARFYKMGVFYYLFHCHRNSLSVCGGRQMMRSSYFGWPNLNYLSRHTPGSIQQPVKLFDERDLFYCHH